ncbi:flavodoxin FldA [Calothrix sp. NIES-4071]|nr:flavodoxin FldA [Calothrix sp. NIES-4071]BAZ54836.1 flavodoxin FldA [Calothrix sp. NIES-4105]
MSAKIGLFYGSTTGKTDAIAELIRNEFGKSLIDLHCMAEASEQDFADYDYLIIGSPTWGIGKLQHDWEVFFPRLDYINFKGKKVAYFGLGDQVEYPYNFVDAMGILAAKITSLGGIRVGSWSTEGYYFEESKALISFKPVELSNGFIALVESQVTHVSNGVRASIQGDFVGLAIDEDNQPELSIERIRIWVAQVKERFEM